MDVKTRYGTGWLLYCFTQTYSKAFSLFNTL